MKPFLNILVNLNVLALLLYSSLTNSAEYRASKNKTWHGVAKFDAQVTSVKNRDSHLVTFNAVALEEFAVEISHNFPRLDPKDATSCERFKRDVAAWVVNIQIKDYQIKYRARLPQGKLHLTLKPPRMQQLNCQLADVALKFDQETCTLSLGRLQVIVHIPGVEGGFVVDIVDSKLSAWTSDKVSYKELQAQDTSVICVNRCGEVFIADGHRRSCSLPCITGVESFINARVETFAYYVPTPKKYKDAIASIVLPDHKAETSEGEVCYLEPNSDDEGVHNFSEVTSSVSMYSVEEDDGDDTDRAEFDPYQFFEITGAEQKISVDKNPFLWFKKDGSCHYTKASQVPCRSIRNGVLDATSLHKLQIIEATNILTGDKHNWPTDEFGLRWPILDEDNQPILPISCKIKRLPCHFTGRDLRELNMPKEQLSNEIYQFKDDKSLVDFPLVYNGALNNSHAALDFTDTFTYGQAYLYENMKIHTLPITSLDVDSWSSAGRRCPAIYDMRKFPKITKLRLNIGWETNYYSVFTTLSSRMPLGNVTDIAVVYDDNYQLCFDCCRPAPGHQLDSELQFRSVSIKGGCIYNYTFIYGLAEYIRQNPNLRELYLDIRFPDRNNPDNRGFDIPYAGPDTGYSLGYLKPALEKSGLSKLVFVQYVPDDREPYHHAEYSRLIYVLKEYQQKKPNVVVFEKR